MPRRAERDPTPLWLAGALTLGLGIQLALPQPSPLADLTALDAEPVHVVGRSAEATRSWTTAAPAYAAILDRPLFSLSRSGAVAADIASPGALALLGVASDGGRASATLATAGGAARSLRLGEAIAGWRLSGVERDHAILSRGGVLQVLKVGAPPQASASAPVASPVEATIR